MSDTQNNQAAPAADTRSELHKVLDEGMQLVADGLGITGEQLEKLAAHIEAKFDLNKKPAPEAGQSTADA